MGRPSYQVNLKLNPELIYLIEALKVEGYWSMKSREGAIQNKNLSFLGYIERLLKNIGLNVSKRILVKLKIPEKIKKEHIKLYNQSRELKFHIQKSPFDESKRKIVFYIHYAKKIELSMKIKNKKYRIRLNENKDEFKINPIGIGGAYGELRFWNMNFIRFLNQHCRNKKDLRTDFNLISNKKKFFAAVVSAIIDSEGSINYYQYYRKIRIRMRSKNYILDIKKLLNLFRIDCAFICNERPNYLEYEVNITGWEDFNKLMQLGLDLHHSKKNNKLNIILNSFKRKQVSRNMARLFYLNELKKINKPITTRILSDKLGKNKRVVSHYLTRLMRKNLINVDKSNVAYLYSSK